MKKGIDELVEWLDDNEEEMKELFDEWDEEFAGDENEKWYWELN